MDSNREKELNRRLVVERRVLFACTVMIGLSVILWVVAICTDWWFVVSGGPNGIYVNETKRFFMHSNSGLWRICRESYAHSTVDGGANVTSHTVVMSGDTTVNVTSKVIIYKVCKFHHMLSMDTKTRNDPAIDKTILNYNRSEGLLSIISLMLMILGFIFSVYTFCSPRYMFKRLAGGIHLLACACVIAVTEILISSIDYEKRHLPYTFPRGATYSYGYSIVLARLVFVMLLVSGCVFFYYSRKRKGSKAPNEEIAREDEPVIIGR